MSTTENFETWIDRFFEEKVVDLEQGFELEGPSGLNLFSYDVVVAHLKACRPEVQEEAKTVLVKIDLLNGDPLHFLRHLAGALVR